MGEIPMWSIEPEKRALSPAARDRGHATRPAAAARALCVLAVAAPVIAEAAPFSVGAPSLRPARIVEPIAVFGSDDRVKLPASHKGLADKIGVILNVRTKSVCTAFCVAPNVVATAAHCLFHTSGEQPARLSDIRFRTTLQSRANEAAIEGAERGSGAQFVLPGSTHLSIRPPINATDDWALLRLVGPACRKGSLAISTMTQDEVIEHAGRGEVFQVAYHRDFPGWRLALGRGCEIGREFNGSDWPSIARDFSDPGRLLLHACDTGGASSGSPLIVNGLNGPEVVGINVGTYVQSKVMMQNGEVIERLGADTIANTGLTTAPIAQRLAAFRDAAILDSPREISALQEALSRRDMYHGAIDGAYGPMLRVAIERCEQEMGLAVTGLASEALLARLNGVESTRRPPNTQVLRTDARKPR